MHTKFRAPIIMRQVANKPVSIGFSSKFFPKRTQKIRLGFNEQPILRPRRRRFDSIFVLNKIVVTGFSYDERVMKNNVLTILLQISVFSF